MATIKDLPPDVQRKWREFSSKGGKAGSHESKVRAGQASWKARLKKMKEAAKQQPV